MALLKSGTRIYGNAIVDTNLSINGSTVSSNYQSGALVVAGGVGIAGNVFINANLNAKDTIITGNLTVTGTTTTVNSTTTQLQDPIIDIGGGANGAALTTDDGLARGLALNYYNVGPKTGFIGWDNSNTQFAIASNVANTTGTLVINTYGDLKANSFVGNVVGTANLSQLTVNGITRLGNVGNVKITGGSPNYILQTDGQGNLVWVASSSTSAAGTNTQVQFNTGNAFDASANFVFDNSSKTLTVDNIAANGAGLTNITGANVTGFVSNANVSNTAYSVAGANVTGFVSNANVSNTAYSVSGGNVTGQVANALVSGTVYSNSQPNITSVGTLVSLSVTGDVNAATVTGSLTTSSQPNITSVGNLTGLTVSGNISVSNGIRANGSYGNLFDVLTSDGTGNTEWKARYYYSTVMYDFTDYDMGYQTIAPNQDPATLGFLPNVSIPHGSVWMLITNDGLDDPEPITIYSPNSKATPMMWVTIDGSGPYDPDTNPNGGDYWFNITPPA